MGPPAEWCAARMSARESKGRLPAYEQTCTSCTDACWLYAWREGPLQLVEHSGDAAGVVPAIAHIPGRAKMHHL